MDEYLTPHTYQQAAEALGIEAEAVRARLRRGALRRRPLTNDRRPTVLLSPAEIATIRASVRTQPAESAPDSVGRPDRRDRRIAALEAERDAARIAAAAAEGEVKVRQEAEVRERQAREAAERELAAWTAGGPLARAWRALAYRRGRA